MHDLIIIGAGTAGLSAAIYGCRAGKKVPVLILQRHYMIKQWNWEQSLCFKKCFL